MSAVAGVLAASGPAFAAPGDLDRSFGSRGKVVTQLGKGHASALDVLVVSNDRIVVGGSSEPKGGTGTVLTLVRYKADGSVDPTFGKKGVVTTPLGAFAGVNALALQSDGKIVAGGHTSTGANTDFVLTRYNEDGSLDTTFSGDGIVTTDLSAATDTLQDVAISPDGKIVAVGQFFTGNRYDGAVVRYHSDGSLDTTFDGDGIATVSISGEGDELYSVAVQSDLKIVAGGSLETPPSGMLVRLTENGAFDPTFDGDGIAVVPVGAGSSIFSLLLEPDGQIVAGGVGILLDGITYRHDFVVARYNTNGSLDTNFGTGGVVTTDIDANTDIVLDLQRQSDGKIVAAGYTEPRYDVDFAVVRYQENGTLDPTFGTGGIVRTNFGRLQNSRRNTIDYAYGAAIQSNGRILLVGTSNKGSTSRRRVDRFALASYQP